MKTHTLIKQVLKKKELTQSALARKIKVHRSSISNWKYGRVPLPIKYKKKLVKLLN